MLHHFLNRYCNYNLENVKTSLAQLEMFDWDVVSLKNRDLYEAGKEIGIDLKLNREESVTEVGDIKRGVYVLSLEGGILNCPQPLVPNTEVKFSFERAPATYSLFFDSVGAPFPTALDNGKAVDIKDCYLQLEYVSSPYLRNLQASIVDKPITYHYDDCQIYMKDVSKGSQTFRVHSLCGGLTPEYIFAGFMPSKCLDPDFMTTSIKFENPHIREACITLNGAPVQGYPITPFYPDNPAQIYSQFIDTIGKRKMALAGGTIPVDSFKDDFLLLSHHFEGEQSNEGWIGFDIKFSEAAEKDYTFGKFSVQVIWYLISRLVVFTIRNNALTIDRFHKVTKALF